MAKINVITRTGVKIELAGRSGLSLMEHIRQAGIDEIVAACGGCCSCATCHVYVEQAPPALPDMQEDEADLLESAEQRQPNSRLSCQIEFMDGLDGITVRIAPEE